MTAANKRPLSATIPASTSSSPSKSAPSPSPARSAASSAAIPKFLTQPLPTLIRKFRAINAHEAHIRITNPLAILNHHLAKARNRYPDVHPWSHNRIHLSSLPFPYINASPIDLGRPDERFIATQGPLGTAEGTRHFWEMVWQEQVEVVVMLTQVVEEGREKCGEYFPEAVSEIHELDEDWGTVECVSLREEHGTEIRELRLVKRSKAEGVDGQHETEKSRTVWHFLFLAWPDHEVPQTPEDQNALLELIKMTRFRIDDGIRIQPQPAETVYKPRIVHCSAGVGRTGTFIALDYLLQELEQGNFDHLIGDGREVDGEEIDPVFDAVKTLREQRMLMVYKPGQFAYIYRVLRENWEARREIMEGKKVEDESPETNGPRTQKRKFSRDDGLRIEYGGHSEP